jgi:RNA polymerase sigma-70 factor (ECF subfamily)
VQVIALLQCLPARQREVIVLRFYQEFSLEEISTITGAPLGTVKSRLFHGLRRARMILEQEEVNQDERCH